MHSSLAVATGTAGAQDAEVGATLETELFFDNDLDDADVDDPAIWVLSQDRFESERWKRLPGSDDVADALGLAIDTTTGQAERHRSRTA